METKEEKRKSSKDKSMNKPKSAAAAATKSAGATKLPEPLNFSINPVPPQLGFSNPATFWPVQQTMSAEFYQLLPVDQQSTATNDTVTQQQFVYGSASDYSIHRLTSNSTAATDSNSGIFFCPILLFSFPLYSGGLTGFHSLFFLGLLHCW